MMRQNTLKALSTLATIRRQSPNSATVAGFGNYIVASVDRA